jgi:hypothetical protein
LLWRRLFHQPVEGFDITYQHAEGRWTMHEPMASVPLTADDLLRMGYVDDPLLLEDVSLCSVCSYTCAQTGKTN